MRHTPLRLLLVEDNEDEAALIVDRLTSAGFSVEALRIETEAGLRRVLDGDEPDAVIADYTLRQFSGMDALRIVREGNSDIPFIVYSAAPGEELAVAAMRAGAQDYVMKDNLGRLGAAVERGLAESRLKRQMADDQRALAASELRYRVLMDQASDAIFISDENGCFLDVNQSAAGMLGYSAPELLRMRVHDLVPNGDQIALPLRSTEMIVGESALVIRRLARKDGSHVQAEISIKVLPDRRVQSIVRETTERDLAQRQLLESEVRFNLLAAATLDCIYDWDMVAPAFWTNQNFRNFLGHLESAETALAWWTERLHPEDRERAAAELDEAIASHDTFALQYRFRTGAGAYAHMLERGCLVRDAGGKAIRMIGSIIDMSERVRAEQALCASEAALRNSEERFRALVEHASDMIAILDRDGTVQYEAPAVLRILGYTPQEREGRSPFELVHPDDRERVMAEFRSAMAANAETHRAEFRMQHKDGSWRHIESIGRNLLEHPAVRGIVVNSRDLTERKLIERQLEQAQRLSSLGRLAATVAHEFNNVLMGIQPFAEIVDRHAANLPALRTASEHIRKSVKRGSRITQEILRFTQPVDPIVQRIDISAWIAEIRPELASLLLPNQDLAIVATPGIEIEGDPAQLAQVLTNLVLNARDAMSLDGGRFTIEVTTPSAESHFAFGVVPEAENFVHFRVSDTGVGIPPSIMAQIFEPLFTTKRSGTGLGLAICRQIVERHGGEMFVESREHYGTTFHLFLPQRKTLPSTKEGLPVPPATRESERVEHTVLLVEDDAAVAAGIAALLGDDGFSVRVAATAAECLESLRTSVPDAVVLDFGLPDMDGLDLYAKIAADRPGLPVVFSTGHGDRSRIESLLRRPNVAFLQKPYEMTRLRDVLDAIDGRVAVTAE